MDTTMTVEQIILKTALKHKWLILILIIVLLLVACATESPKVAFFSFILCPTNVKLRPDYEWVRDGGLPAGSTTIVWTAKTAHSASYQCAFVVPSLHLEANLP